MAAPPVRTLPLVVTMGEPAGIGGEIALKAWAARRADSPPFFVIDDVERLHALARRFNISSPVDAIAAPHEAIGVFGRALPVLAPREPLAADVTLGAPTETNAAAVVAAIDQAVDLVLSGAAAGVVTNPINKAALRRAGFGFPGHTEYLGHLAGGAETVMMLAVQGLRVIPVTVHVAIKDVAKVLTTSAIVRCGRMAARALKTDFGVLSPRLAVAALNPHAGENGQMGDEEERIIVPAVNQLRAEGIDVAGPSPADTLFHPAARDRYDVALCMFHDQALIPLKAIDFSGGVNVTLGLPFVRTSPDHGTALDIAARGIADPTSLLAAVHLAAAVAGRRLAQRVA